MSWLDTSEVVVAQVTPLPPPPPAPQGAPLEVTSPETVERQPSVSAVNFKLVVVAFTIVRSVIVDEDWALSPKANVVRPETLSVPPIVAFPVVENKLVENDSSRSVSDAEIRSFTLSSVRSICFAKNVFFTNVFQSI